MVLVGGKLVKRAGQLVGVDNKQMRFAAERLRYGTRWARVQSGVRNCGQRSLEVAVWGIIEPKEAALAFAQQLENIVKVQ